MIYRIIAWFIASSVLLIAQYQQGRVMRFLGRYATGLYNVGGAETVAYDSASKRLFLTCAQGSRLIALDIRTPNLPRLVFDSSLIRYGGIVNSVAVYRSLLAVAIEDTIRTNPGKVLLLDTNGRLLSMVTVGSVPDMVTFTPDGRYVLVANEGEPSDDYTIDPEGSVSIIDVQNVSAPTVRTVTFSAFNARRDSLRLCGIRIGAPNNPTVAQDLEPEYIAVSPDGQTAYVTLQENNAIAVIDIPSATVRELLPIAPTDYRKGGLTLTLHEYPISQRPPLGTTPGGQTILLGGLSGLWYDGTTPDGWWRFYAVTDRGPNAEPTQFGSVRYRPFALPSFQPRIVEFHLNPSTGQIRTHRQILLYRSNGTTPLTGLPNMQAQAQNLAYTDEFACDLFGNPVPNDPLGADLEGIVRTPNGDFWACDEYRPALYRFDSSGVLLARYVPIGTAAAVGAAPGTFGQEVFPAVYARRRPNRGFEAIAVEGNKLYLFVQSPLDNPNSTTNAISRNSSIVRILEFDYTTATVTGEYLLPLLQLRSADLVDKIGDAVALGNGQFLVAIRDSRQGRQSKKLLYEVNIRTATNTLTAPVNLPSGATFESLGIQGLINQGIRLAACRLVANVATLGFEPEKLEGLARVNDSTFVIINDNDFGVVATTIPGNGTIQLDPAGGPITVGVLRFTRSQRIDPSDRDNAIRLRYAPGPVFGLPQPDAIATYRASDGNVYLVTANEGDTREYGTYNEQARLNSTSAFPLDPVAFPSAVATQIRRDSLWGRLQAVRTSGDLDGDGDYDELYCSGTRSFSILASDGSLVFDSGDEFDRITAALFPQFYNCSNTNNTFDARSPNRGVEPEGVAITTIGDSTYAFICFERIGGVAMYNITNPSAVRFVDYLNTRNFAQTPGPGTGGDLGPEVVYVIPSSMSPNKQTLVITANEISGTVAIYGIEPIEVVRRLPPTQYICYGNTLVLEVSATGPSLQYQWFKDGQPISGATGPSYAVAATTWNAAGVYSCTVIPTAGLSRPLDAGRCTVVVTPPATILRQPPATVAALPGRRVELSVEVSHESPLLRYQWLRNGQPLTESSRISGVRTSLLRIAAVTPSDTGVYTCVIFSACGTLQTSPSRVLIPTPPHATIQPVVVGCEGQPLQRSFSLQSAPSIPLIAARAVNRQRILPLVLTPNSLGFELDRLTAQDTGTYTVIVVMTLQNDTAEFTIGQFRIAFLAPVQIQGISQSSTLCPEGSTDLVATVRGDSVTLQWYRDNVPIPNATTNRISVGAAGIYTLVATNSCGREQYSQRVEQTAFPAFTVNLPPQIVADRGEQVELRVEAPAATQFQWYRNGAIISGATQPRYSFTLDASTRGTYFCRATNDCGTATSRPCVVDFVSTVELSTNSTWGIFPNPLDRNESAVLLLPPGQIIDQIVIFDARGRIVGMQNGVTEQQIELQRLVDLSQLASGTYFVRLQRETTVWVASFTIQR
ncbi:MAG: esterase-like activity of phytase family protein [Candidatus Kapabacteria bacterium]|nr:esterase-like activity of phytase family protein [Candidatus Kapabacteria bacterium]